MSGGTFSGPEQIQGKGNTDEQDRRNAEGQRERRAAEDREDQASEEEAFKESKGENAGGKANRIGEKETADFSCLLR